MSIFTLQKNNMKISVCIATYNGAKYIEEQVQSILYQLSEKDEINISVDGSKDNTLAIIKSLNDARIKVIHNTLKHGLVSNFENAIKHADGDYIFLSDQDDIWTSNKVEVCLQHLQNADLVVHNALLINASGEKSNIDFFSIRGSQSGYWKNLYKNSFIGCCMAFKSNLLNYILPFPKHILWHDMWIGLTAEKKGKTFFIPDILLYYRRHGENASPTSEKSSFSRLQQILYRLQFLYYTIFR